MKAASGPRLESPGFFRRAIEQALADGVGFASGKLGISEIQRLNFSIAASRPGVDPRLLKLMKPNLHYHSLQQSALFPASTEFYLRFNEFFVDHLSQLNCLGVFPDLLARMAVHRGAFGLTMPWIDYRHQEPDRSSPAREDLCYLPLLEGRRLLLISSCAELLRERARREVFEAVWARSGKRWFNPAAVLAIEFPYGYSPDTHRLFPDSMALFQHLQERMAATSFDIALIAAGGLGIPLAAAAAKLGGIGLSLGGHLQVLFGVHGKRWLAESEWHHRHFNDAWIRMPAAYRPPGTDLATVADGGAYW